MPSGPNDDVIAHSGNHGAPRCNPGGRFRAADRAVIGPVNRRLDVQIDPGRHNSSLSVTATCQLLSTERGPDYFHGTKKLSLPDSANINQPFEGPTRTRFSLPVPGHLAAISTTL